MISSNLLFILSSNQQYHYFKVKLHCNLKLAALFVASSVCSTSSKKKSSVTLTNITLAIHVTSSSSPYLHHTTANVCILKPERHNITLCPMAHLTQHGSCIINVFPLLSYCSFPLGQLFIKFSYTSAPRSSAQSFLYLKVKTQTIFKLCNFYVLNFFSTVLLCNFKSNKSSRTVIITDFATETAWPYVVN